MNQKRPIDDRELEALLQALQGTGSVPDQTGDEKTDFAARLVALSQASQIDPVFKTWLDAALRQAARTPAAAQDAHPHHPPQRVRSILSRLFNTRSSVVSEQTPGHHLNDRRPYPMKRVLVALTSAATFVVLIAAAASLPFFHSQSGLPGTSEQASGTGQSAAPTATPVTTPGAASTPTPVPFSAASINAASPWNISEFVLADSLGDLPSAPESTMPLYKQQPHGSYSMDDARRFAAMFGMQLNVYRMQTPGNEDTGLTVIDGPRKLTLREGWMYYSDDSEPNALAAEATLPFTRAAQVAETFLKTAGLLDFEYRAEPSDVNAQITTVHFAPLIGGYPLSSSKLGIYVSVSLDEKVTNLSYIVPSVEIAGDVPVIDAKEAWQALTSGRATRLSTSYDYGRGSQTAAGQRLRVWTPEYRSGADVHLYGEPTTYASADSSGSSVAFINNVRLEGNLDALQDYQIGKGHTVHAWGTLRQEPSGERVLTVDGLELQAQQATTTFSGTIKLEGETVLLQREDGKTLALSNPPASMPDGIAVSGYGWETERTLDGYPVLEWVHIQTPPEQSAIAINFGEVGIAQSVSVQAVAAPLQISSTAVITAVDTTVPLPTALPGTVSTETLYNLPTTTVSMAPVAQAIAAPVVNLNVPFTDGQHLEGVEGNISVYIIEDEDGGNREVQAFLNEQPLDANQAGWQVALTGANLAGIEDLYLLRARVWGHVKVDSQGSTTIEVERYEKADPNARIQAWLGNLITATVEGKSVVVLHSDDGQQYVLAYSIRYPGDKLAQMGRAIVEGVLRPETFGGYPVIEQTSLSSGNGLTDLSGYTITVQPPRQIRVVPSKGIVEEVELVYLVDDVAQVYVADGTLPTPEPARLIVRPVWRFAGHTERGETFEAMVDAIPDSELQKLGIAQTTFGAPDAVTYNAGTSALSVPAAPPTPTAAP